MEDSKTVNMVYRADDPCVGMGLTQDLDRYKLFLADTGLFVTLAFWDKDYTENEIYNKLLNGKRNIRGQPFYSKDEKQRECAEAFQKQI